MMAYRGKVCRFCRERLSTSTRANEHGNRYHLDRLACKRARDRARQMRFVHKKKLKGIDVYAPYRAKAYAKKKARIASGELLPDRKRFPERFAKHDYLWCKKRRAMIMGAPEIEDVDRQTLGDRDGWVCGICELGVDPELRWPDPGSGTTGHIIPLSRGGSHTYANTRLEHLYCNLVKNKKLDHEMA
jgi:hypothetical protein